jgi:hypothetical protein
MTTLQRSSTSRPYQAGDVTGMKIARAEAEQAAKKQIAAERDEFLDNIHKVVLELVQDNARLRARVTVLEEQSHFHPELAEDDAQVLREYLANE